MSRHSENVDLVLLSTQNIISKNETTGVETTVGMAELAGLDGVTAGTVTASKAVIVDASKNIGRFETISTDAINLSSGTPASHPINMEGLTLAADTNAIRGASVNPVRASGWTSFSGTISTAPVQTYMDYRELHTTGTAEVLGAGSFPYMDAGSSCKSLWAGQDIAFVSTGSTVLSAAAVPGVGIFARYLKTTLDGETFTAGGCAAVNFKSFQANVTSVGAEETSIDDIEIASGQINTIWRIRKTAGAISRSLIHFDAATVAPIIQDPTLFHDPNAVTCDKGLHVQIGNVSYMIPLYASDTGAVVADW